MSGDRPDPNILKDGEDYYATFSSFLWYPAVVIWHSRDLVNWTPIGPALERPIGSVWALDIAKHEGRYFIYIPTLGAPDAKGNPFRIYVIHAESMHGPWSDPVDLGIEGFAIDPGHVVSEDGKRYLFVNGGRRVALTADGLATAGPLEQVYDGWPIPDDWVIEATALEGPKLLRRDGWFYMFSGEGGTAGPPTSHMVIVARSRSIDGPWENCPHNPIVRTASREEPWWSRGHATAVEGPDGRWWLVYHGYENGFRTLGRQMLLEPMEWTADGWPRALGGTLDHALAKPFSGSAGVSALPLSTDFVNPEFGARLTFFDPQPGYLDRVSLGNGLTLRGQGKGPADSSPLGLIAGERSYEMMVDIELLDGAQGGVLLFYDSKLFCGIGAEGDMLHAYKHGVVQEYPSAGAGVGRRLSLKLQNDENVVTFWISPDRKAWRKIVSYEVSGYNHNMGDGFLSLRPALFASGEGRVRFRDLAFRAVDLR
ncbi:family 43 glycosylhydrolase [Novosphingobium sp. 9]|uniref:family 43 glycosylhydrolase n=1 Tax=Novosphingobium sp. 9 TaxID=2025349 RepID=UPI0021B6DE50|nr:family 43 glycosylhydrolase [Novosphingobium sp. 9]